MSQGLTDGQKEATEYQLDRSLEAQGIATGWQQHDGLSRDVLEYLSQTDLPQRSINKFAELIGRDLPLGNYTRPQENELIWNLRMMKILFIEMHPPKSNVLTKKQRAAIFDKHEADCLPALSDKQLIEVDRVFTVLETRVTRGRDMDQQKMTKTTISQTEVNRPQPNGKTGIMGRIRR